MLHTPCASVGKCRRKALGTGKGGGRGCEKSLQEMVNPQELGVNSVELRFVLTGNVKSQHIWMYCKSSPLVDWAPSAL